jgi:diaminohydroxyphosphoribosylaminopyrimidine deaminase/5-amino-6-(5-phosphoribosylamino)uracil reductase
MLSELGRRGVNAILCEGGGELAGALVAEGLADEAAVFIAPKIVGGKDAPGPVGGAGARRMAEAWPVARVEWRRVGDDMLATGLLREKSLAPPSPDAI